MPRDDELDVVTRIARPTPERKLANLLSTLEQGDLVSMGAVSIVGYGRSELGTAVGNDDEQEGLWSITVEPEVGWYVVLSQDCDIVRHYDDEPCLLVCPLKFVGEARWNALRHGPYSPREFPFTGERLNLGGGGFVVADLRYVTSLDKQALLEDNVRTLRPLSPPQKERFQAWVGSRFWRAPISDAVNEDVLAPVAQCLLGILANAKSDLEAGRNPPASGQLMLAAGEWMVGGSERLVKIVMFTSEALMREAKLPADSGDAAALMESGRDFVEKKLRRCLPSGKGYAITLETYTLDAMSVQTYRDYAPWTYDSPGDPLAAKGDTEGRGEA